MSKNTVVMVELSSDEEADCNWVDHNKPNSLVDSSIDDDDCMVLDNDPNEQQLIHNHNNININSGDGNDDSDDLLVVSEKGQVACRDYPHSRHLCIKFPFSTTPNQSHCEQCYCYVCDSLAPCVYWGNGTAATDHCHATDKDEFWKLERKTVKNGSKIAQPVTQLTPPPVHIPNPSSRIAQPVTQPTPPLVHIPNPSSRIAQPVTQPTPPPVHIPNPGSRMAQPVTQPTPPPVHIPNPGLIHALHNLANLQHPRNNPFTSRKKSHPDSTSQALIRTHQKFNLGSTVNKTVFKRTGVVRVAAPSAVRVAPADAVNVAPTGAVRVARTVAVARRDAVMAARTAAVALTNAARAARTVAVARRDAARAAQTVAVPQTNAARTARTAAVARTNAARAARTAVVARRDAARAAQTVAVPQTNAARTARTAAVAQTNAARAARTVAVSQTSAARAARTVAVPQTNAARVARAVAVSQTSATRVTRTVAIARTNAARVARAVAVAQTDVVTDTPTANQNPIRGSFENVNRSLGTVQPNASVNHQQPQVSNHSNFNLFPGAAPHQSATPFPSIPHPVPPQPSYHASGKTVSDLIRNEAQDSKDGGTGQGSTDKSSLAGGLAGHQYHWFFDGPPIDPGFDFFDSGFMETGPIFDFFDS